MIMNIEKEVTERYRARTTESRNRHEIARRYLPGGETRSATFFYPYPTHMARGEGCYLYDVDGNEYIDYLNNYGSLVHGHAYPAIVEAAIEQVQNGTVLGAAAELQTKLAALLCERIPASIWCGSATQEPRQP